MIKNKLDFKLINICLLFLIFYFIYQTSDFWIGILNLIWKIILPFLIALAIAYAFYPFICALRKKHIPKSLAIFIVVGGVLGILGLVIYLVTPLFFSQVTSLFSAIISFLRELSFLTIHGLLHLLGYDHMVKEDEEVMFKKQDELLNEFGIVR